MASNTTDLNRDEKQAIPLLANNEKEKLKRYKPKTLKRHNSARQIYLPLFPTIAFGPNNYPLLANVPGPYFQLQFYDLATIVINIF